MSSSSNVPIIYCYHQQNVLRKPSRATPTKSNEALRSTTNINCNNSAESPNCKKDFKEPPTNTTSPHSTTNHDPMITTTPAPSGPPIKPPRNPARALRRSSKENAVRASRSSLARASGGLSYKASTVSTASVYSTQSEEPQTRVPAAVIVAALGHTFGTRRLSTLHHTYTIGEEQLDSELAIPRRRLRHPLQSDSVGQLHRISNISDGSLGLQDGPYTVDPIGVAYGGEDCEEPFCEGDKEQLAVEQFYVPEGSLDHEIAHDGCSTDIH